MEIEIRVKKYLNCFGKIFFPQNDPVKRKWEKKDYVIVEFVYKVGCAERLFHAP